MGATNEIKETNISLQLTDKKCSQCQQKFTKEEITDRNYDIWFDTTNDVKLVEMEKLSKKFEREHGLRDFNENFFNLIYYPFGKTGYQFSIWIRSIEHENCPDRKEKEAPHA